jgi:PKD repeat protein
MKKKILALVLVLLMILPAPAFIATAGDGSRQEMEPRATYTNTFTNVTDAVGLGGKGGTWVSWGDYNNDGYQDLLVNGKTLYENQGSPNFDFVDVTAARGISVGGSKGTFADFDNDGYLDFYSAGNNDYLYRNLGPPNYDFQDVTISAGHVSDPFPSSGAGWGDFDRDGDLDLYVANGEVWVDENNYWWYPDVFYVNNGNGTFSNATDVAGVNTTSRPYYGRGVAWSDFDNDGWSDIYISNYRIKENYLWYNNRNGTFTDKAEDFGVQGIGRYSNGDVGGTLFGHTIGSSWGDLNNDGRLDLAVANLAHKHPNFKFCDDSKIYINNGPPDWELFDIRESSGIPLKPTGGTIKGWDGLTYYDDENFANMALADFDNDGYLDIWIPQVYNLYWMYAYLYRNNGNLTFTNTSNDLGIDVVDTYGGAWADYDNDGDLDLATIGRTTEGIAREIHLFRNDGGTNNWLKVKLTGVDSNSMGIGARVTVRYGDSIQIREVEGGMGSHGQQNDLPVEFGLGKTTTIDEVEVRWPDGKVQIEKNVAANQTLDITEITTNPRITSMTGYQEVMEDEEVALDGSATGTVGTYYWDLEGDGTWDVTSSTNSQQLAYYDKKGIYHPTFMVLDTNGLLGDFQTTTVLVRNLVPGAKIGNDFTGFEDEVQWFDAKDTSDTISDYPNLTYNFSFGDGTYSGWQNETFTTHVYTAQGNYTVKVDVMDDDGAEDQAQLTVEILNVAPSIEINATDTVPEDQVHEFNATGNDTASDLPTLEYKWLFGDGDSSDWSSDPVINHTFTEAGIYLVYAFVRDDDLNESKDNIVITVTNPQPAVMIGDFATLIEEDEAIFFTGSASDNPSDAGDLEYKWDFGDGNATAWGDNPDTTHIYTMSGNYTATFYVRDNNNDTVNDTVTIKVLNVVPTCEIVEAPVEASEDEEIELLGLGYDTTTDQLSLGFMWDFGDGNATGWNSSPATVHTYTSSGDMLVTFYVVDNDGEVNQAETVITVINPVPEVTMISPANTRFKEDEAFVLKAEVNDNPSDQDSLEVSWEFAGQTFTGLEKNITMSEKGLYTATVTVTDDDGDQATESMEITIENVAPTAEASAGATYIEVGLNVNFNGTGSDTESDAAGLTYTWDFGDGQTATGGSATHAYTSPGEFTVTFTVKDDDGDVAKKQIKITVWEPEKPGPEEEFPVTIVAAAGGIVAIIVVILVLGFMGVIPLFGKKKGKTGLDDEDEDDLKEEEEDSEE